MTRPFRSFLEPTPPTDASVFVEADPIDARYRSVVDNSPYGIYRVSLDGRFVTVNRALCAIVGYSHDELMAANIGTLYADSRERIRLLAEFDHRPQGAPVEVAWRRRDGHVIMTRVWVYADRDADGSILHLDGYVEDVTEIRATEAALRQSEKLVALGQLVSGVAHELNNPLSAILLFAEDLLATERSCEDRDALGIIVQQARRSRAIVRDLLTFVRSREVTRESVDAVAFFEQVTRALLPQLAQLDVTLRVDVDAETTAIHVDRAAIEQVVTNLVVNGAQAAGPGGTVVLRGARVADAYVIQVLDDGAGIPADTLSRIFEPFFTTKPIGQGTGLGLSVSLGLVQQHGGTITVENRDSREGTGASFVVRLPLPPSARGVPVHPVRLESSGDSARQRSVLIVDDEETIRSALSRFYTRRGWSVSEAPDGAVALERLVDRGECFDLVLSDVKMPRVSGIELHAALRAARPELLPHLVFCTGEVESRAVASFVADSGCRVLLKPFDLRTLASVSEEVAAPGSAGAVVARR